MVYGRLRVRFGGLEVRCKVLAGVLLLNFGSGGLFFILFLI